MALERSLVCWIGHNDLWSMAHVAGDAAREAVLREIGEPKGSVGELGPIKTLVNLVQFRRVDLVSNYDPVVNEHFARWLGCAPNIHEVELVDPTNYESVVRCANEALEQAWAVSREQNLRLCIHLSPGTPTMAAIWVLLGKTRFPATFYQTHGGSVIETNIPFDLQLDYLPELLRDPDRSFQSLTLRSPGEVHGFERIIGESQSVRLSVELAKRTAIRSYSVLLTGESGTGKEEFARAMHAAGPWQHGKFVALNCAAIPDTLFEAELFGAKRGAATGVEERVGAFQEADEGTLFLDEVGECSLQNQAKLLRAVQTRSGDPPRRRYVQRVGENVERPVHVRIIAATNRNLLERVADHAFRDDLYYRLGELTIELPPLRKRGGDIRLLAEYFLARINRECSHGEPGYEDKSLNAGALDRLKKHTWPGNVRELNNVLRQAAVMALGRAIGSGDIERALVHFPESSARGPFVRERSAGFDLKARLDAIEQAYVEDALADANGVQAEAARLLGLKSAQALKKKIDRLGIRMH